MYACVVVCRRTKGLIYEVLKDKDGVSRRIAGAKPSGCEAAVPVNLLYSAVGLYSQVDCGVECRGGGVVLGPCPRGPGTLPSGSGTLPSWSWDPALVVLGLLPRGPRTPSSWSWNPVLEVLGPALVFLGPCPCVSGTPHWWSWDPLLAVLVRHRLLDVRQRGPRTLTSVTRVAH